MNISGAPFIFELPEPVQLHRVSKKKTKRLHAKLNINTINALPQLSCCKKYCLKSVDLNTLCYDRQDLHSRSEKDKNAWITTYKSATPSKTGGTNYVVQKKVIHF